MSSFYRSCLFTKASKASDASWTTYINPMSFNSWVMSATTFAFATFVLVIVYSKSEEDEITNLSWPVFITTTSLAQQGNIILYF